MNVTDQAQIAPLFAQGPSGGTPMIGALRRLFSQYSVYPMRVLLIFVTDGEPSDGSYSQLFQVLQWQGCAPRAQVRTCGVGF